MFVSVFAIVSHAAAYYHIYLHSIGSFKNILTENIGRGKFLLTVITVSEVKTPPLSRSGEIGFQMLLFWLLLSLFKHC